MYSLDDQMPRLICTTEWHSYFSDGTILPVVSGGSTGQGEGSVASSGDVQASTVAAMQQGAASPGGNGQGAQGAQPQGQPNQFLQGILDQVDPAHRAIVEPYINKWNAGVTRRFQDLHGELTPYKELGADPERLGMGLQLLTMIDESPQEVMALLQQVLGGEEEDGQQAPQGIGNQTPEAPPTGGLPPELDSRLKTFETVLEAMAQQFLDQKSSAAEQAEDKQLGDYLDLLKSEMGDFDEDYVIAKMLAGMDGADAVGAYQQAIQGQVNSRARTPNVGPILGGGGAVPGHEGPNVATASSKDTKALVAQILAASGGS